MGIDRVAPQHSTPQRSLHVALLVALALVVHQFVMATPAHLRAMPMAMPDRHAALEMGYPCPCPHETPAMLRECPAVEAALRIAPLLALLWFAIALLAALTTPRPVGPLRATAADWRWPPRRRRALLQVFRC